MGEKNRDNLVADIFGTMEGRVNPDGVDGITANYGYVITGPSGGNWTVCLENGKVSVREKLVTPDVITTCKDEDWIDITLGKLDGMTAFSSGRLKVEGKMDILPRAANFFKPYTPPGGSQEIVEELAPPYRDDPENPGSLFMVSSRDNTKILGLKCKECDRVFVPLRSTCGVCFGDISKNWVELSGQGIVTKFAIVRNKESGQSLKPPYIKAFIKLDGVDAPFEHIVKGLALSKMQEGLRVEAVFTRQKTSTVMEIDHFKPVNREPKFKLGYSYDELEEGMSDSFTKTISETDVYLFAGISGDFNPMHMNEEFAKTTPMGTRIAHGALPQCLIAPVLGMKLPGLGTIALEITTRFKAPTYFGDTITATGEVVEKLPERRWVRMDLTFTNQHNELVAQGSALVLPPMA
ncbi:MAG: hypothetical protein GY710_00160 [Desulfobacteraceae bacterium]|nr:hypothetical protein [Desulfobacteraceae bacterium]